MSNDDLDNWGGRETTLVVHLYGFLLLTPSSRLALEGGPVRPEMRGGVFSSL